MISAESAPHRIYRLMIALGSAGTIAMFVLRGWRWGLGFSVGAVISLLNFRAFEKIVAMIGLVSQEGGAPKRVGAVFLGARYLLFAGAAYVIIRVLDADLLAALLGLFVCVGAVLIEILYELIYTH
jgi:hypothetical protein